MPVVVIASFTVKPESLETVEAACAEAVADVHNEPGCQLYSLHRAGNTLVFIEQWADADALAAHSRAPAVATMFAAIGDHLDGAPQIQMLEPIPAGDPAKGQLRA